MASTRGKTILFALWASLIAWWIVGAPAAHPTIDRALWGGLLTGRFDGIDPAVVGVFLLLGVTADLFVVLLLRDGRFQKLPGWPFALASFGLGSFVVVPYLLLRSKNPPRERPPGRATRVLSSRPIGWVIAAALLALVGWTVARGDASALAAAFRTSMLVQVMTLDLLLETLLLAWLVEESRHLDPPHREPAIARALRFVPLLGPALWNALVTHDP